jgi:hypothetical protein
MLLARSVGILERIQCRSPDRIWRRPVTSYDRAVEAQDTPGKNEEGEGRSPDVSVVVPVNAQGDLQNVRTLLADVARYGGPHALETILVVNNFPEGAIPSEVGELEDLATAVLAIPNVRKPGEAIGFSARIPGIRAASSEYCVLFDADCRIPDPTSLLNWYVARFRTGAQAAYTHVGYHDFEDAPSVRLFFAVHYAARWVKRRILGIPTTRGSNYAVRRDAVLDLYDRGLLADEMNVGPAMKRLKGPVLYGRGRSLHVLTSGRMFSPGWRNMLPYFLYRLRYNLRVLPVRPDVAQYTGRENDPVRRYDNNAPIREPR